MKKLSAIVALFSVVLLATPAQAGSYACTGTVTFLGVDSFDYGLIVVGGPGGLPPIGLCALNQAGNFTMDACKAIYATLLAAKMSGQTVEITFADGLTCSTQPAWGSAGSTSAWFVATQQ